MPLWKRNLFACWFGSFTTMAGSSLVIPFLPFYIKQLGVTDLPGIERWSGIAFAATFMISALVSPLWGKLADLYGRKLMLLRASVGLAVVMVLLGFVQNVYQLVGLRLMLGVVSGFVPAAITLVATQTPREHAGWALGTLSTGTVGGTLLGPLVGGWLAEWIGFRHVFFVTGSFMFISFLVTAFFIKEDFIRSDKAQMTERQVWNLIPNPRILIAMFITTFMIQFANMSIEPIVTVYVQQLVRDAAHVALISGVVVSASGLAAVLSASRLGKLSDQIGPQKVLLFCLISSAFLIIPQAFVQSPWQLVILRFLLGIATAGMLPAVNSLVRFNVPDAVSGRVFGYNQSAQYLGNIAGPILGGQLAAGFGIHYVFFFTSILLFANGVWVKITSNRLERSEQTTRAHEYF